MPEYCTNSPSFHGFIGNTLDALVVLQGCCDGILPRVEGRLSDDQRKAIKSGDIYVFNVDESKIKRWTDGRRWSPSRILNNFLVYRELVDDTSSSTDDASSTPAATPDSASWLATSIEPLTSMPGTSSRSSVASTSDHKPNIEQLDSDVVDKVIRALPGNNSSKGLFLRNGLIKKSITIAGYHIIGYYRASDFASGLLRSPTSDARLSSLTISHDFLCSKFFRHPPLVTFDQDGKARFAGLTDAEPMVRRPPQTSRPRRMAASHKRSESSSSGKSVNSDAADVDIAVSQTASPFSFSAGNLSPSIGLPLRLPDEVYFNQWTPPMQVLPSAARSEPARQRSHNSLRESALLHPQPRPASSSARFQPYALAQPRSSPAVMMPLPQFTPNIAAPPAFAFPNAQAWQIPPSQHQQTLQQSLNMSTTTISNRSFYFDRGVNHTLQMPFAQDPMMQGFNVAPLPIANLNAPLTQTAPASGLPSGLPFTPHNDPMQDLFTTYVFP